MRILHAYLAKRYLWFVLGAVFLFSFLYIVGDLFGHLEDILKNKVPLRIVISYYASMVPLVLVNTFPLASLLSGLYVVGDMNYGNEIIAIRTSGRPIGFVLVPLFFSSVLVSSVMFFVNERFVPASTVFTSSVKEEFIKRNRPVESERVVIRNLTFYGKDNALYFISEYYPEKALMRGVVILFQDPDQNIREKWVAEEGKWQEGKWIFKNLIIYRFGSEKKLEESKRFYPEKVVQLPESPRDMVRREDMLESLNIKRLREAISRLRRSDAEKSLIVFQAQMANRIVSALSPIVLLLAGIPLVLRVQRKPPGFSVFGIGMLIFLFYYGINTVFFGLAKAGWANPWMVMFSVPVLFLAYFGIAIASIP